MTTTIDTDFHGGAIEVVRIPKRGAVELALRGDGAADVKQWFSFKVRGGETRDLAIRDITSASFAGSWDRYQAMMSTDGRQWRRAPTRLEGDSLRIRHEARAAMTHYAYFAPYSDRRLAQRLKEYAACEWMSVGPIGQTVMEAPLPIVRVGDEDREQTIWIMACQHPGETPAAWAAEGLLARLMDGEDEAVQTLLERAKLVVVPFVNLDGSRLGNHRTNAVGTDLNRAWDDPDPDQAPEVRALLDAIDESPPDFVIDLHADESAQFVFASKSEGNPSYDEEIQEAEDAFSALLADLSPDFLDESFYDPDEPGEANLAIAANQLGERYGVPAITLELPMGAAGTEKIREGWSPERAAGFGADVVAALAAAMER